MKVTAKKERHMERPTVWDTDIEQFLTPQRVLVVQIIQSALAVGALAFLAVVFSDLKERHMERPTVWDTDIEQFHTPQRVLVVQIIQSALAVGALAFLAVVFYLYQ